MSDTRQIEMHLRKLDEKISKLNYEVETLKKVVQNLCERLMVQG